MNDDIEAAIREITLPVLIARYGTQMEIARLCGISQGCVSRWRYGVPQHHARMFYWMGRAERAEEGPDDWETGDRIAAEAYQVIGSLASEDRGNGLSPARVVLRDQARTDALRHHRRRRPADLPVPGRRSDLLRALGWIRQGLGAEGAEREIGG